MSFSIDMRANGNALKVQVVTLITGLALEINTENRMRLTNKVNCLKVAKGLGFTGRTKVEALKWLVETADSFGYEPDDYVTKALSK